MVLRDPKDPLNQSRGIMGPIEGSTVQNNRGRLRQRFDLIRKLGQGTYGKVQLGIDKETGQEVAIKTIKKSKIETDADLIRIRREIQIMSSVRHPNIIHIYEVFENREKMVLVMEYASGGELYDYLSERKVLEEDEARRIFRQIASAVYYCHKHKICHRDLKLENILLDEKANAKIADFGLSNVFDDVNLLKTFCGSPLYASPEIVRGTPYYGPEVDCWSLGVLLYTLVYGAMPFDGSNFKRLVKQISNGEYYEPKKPAEASLLIRRMLTVDPLKRTSIKEVCSHQWINKGFSRSCLESAEELANQTPVRLDLLLSVAPGHNINHSQVVIACNQDEINSLPSEPPGTKSVVEQTAGAVQSKPEVNVARKQSSVAVAKAPQSNKMTVSKVQDSKLKASAKKKSKSSPLLELIADEEEDIEKPALGVEQYENCNQAGDEAGDDTLSEISEIQTLAEDGNDASKSKSKLQHKTGAQLPEKEPTKSQSSRSNLMENQKLSAENASVTTVLADNTRIPGEKGADVAEVINVETIAPAPSTIQADPENVADKLNVAGNIAKSTSKVAENKVQKLAEAEKPASKPPTVKKKIVKKISKEQPGKDSASKAEVIKKRSPTKSNATVCTGSSSSVASSADKVEGDSTPSRGTKPRGSSDSNASDASPTRIERRNSKIISQKTAELIQNLETRASNSPPETGKPKKLVFATVKVADAKKAFEKSKAVHDSSISPTQSNVAEKTKPQKSEDPQENKKAAAANNCEKEVIRKDVKVDTKSLAAGKAKIPPEAELKPTESTQSKFEAPLERPSQAVMSHPALQKPDEQNSDAKVTTKVSISKPSEDLTGQPEPSKDTHEPSSNHRHQIMVKKGPAAGLSKLKMPSGIEPDAPGADQQVKPVYVDNGTGAPRQAVMLVAGRTTPPVKSCSDTEPMADPFVSADSIAPFVPVVTEESLKQPMKRAKEQAAQKISSVISKIASSETADRGLKTKEKPVKMVKTEVSFPVAAAPSRERVIPIKFDDDVVPSTPPAQVQADTRVSSKTQSAPNIVGGPLKYDRSASTVSAMSRQNSSDTESSIAPPRKLDAIRKSPREFIIPIKLEASGQTLTPKDEPTETPHSEDPFRADCRLRSGRFGRHKRYSSLLSDSSYEDEPKGVQSAGTSRRSSTTTVTPCHTRSHSQGDEPEAPQTPLTATRRFRIKRGSGVPLDRSESFSSAEEDEEDAFEVLTAESLFSSLLDRVRNLTKRLNRDEEATTSWSTGPGSPTIGGWAMAGPFREFVSRASSESRPTGSAASGELRIRRSFSREPSVTVTISTGPTWRSSLSRQTSRDSDNGSIASDIQSSVSPPMYTAGCRSGFYPYRRTSGNDTDDGSQSKSSFSTLDRIRRPSMSDSQPRHFDTSCLPVTSAYHNQSGASVRPYGRSLSNTDYNLRSSTMRHSLNSHDKPRGGQIDSVRDSAVQAATSIIRDRSLSGYSRPRASPSDSTMNSSAFATSRVTLPRIGRSASAAPSEPRQGVNCSQHASEREDHFLSQHSASKLKGPDGTASASMEGTPRKDYLSDEKKFEKGRTGERTSGLVLSRDAVKKTGGNPQSVSSHTPHYCAVGGRIYDSAHDDIREYQTNSLKNHLPGMSKNFEGVSQGDNSYLGGSEGVANKLSKPMTMIPEPSSLRKESILAFKESIGSESLDTVASAAPNSTPKMNPPCSVKDNYLPTHIAPGALPRRDFRAASVDKITRILQQKSMSKDGLASPEHVQAGLDTISTVNATKANTKDDSKSPKVTKPYMSPMDERQAISLSVEPEGHSPNSKGNKPKFIQSLEKRWEKITAPLSGTVIDRAGSRSHKLAQEQDSTEALSNLDRESVLLQRAVSPEKKGKTRFGGSTVGFMLGKFRKIEESTAKTSGGGPHAAPNGTSKRALSSYAGASSDSVLTLPKTVQPLHGSKSNLAVAVQPQISSASVKHKSAVKELSPKKTEGTYEEAPSQNKVYCTDKFQCTADKSLIPRLNAKGMRNTVGVENWDADCDRRLSADVLSIGSRDTHSATSPPSQTFIDEKDYEESITTPTSDSLESSSICSEKNEIWGRSVLDEEESVSDRIFRKSFYPRFNSLDRKKPATRYNSNSASKVAKLQSRAKSLAGTSQLPNDPVASLSCATTPTKAVTSRVEESQSALSDGINKYNPNPLFKELISEELFLPQSSRKAAHSERVTNKLSKLLLEIDSDNVDTTAASKLMDERRGLDLGASKKTLNENNSAE